MKEKKNFGQAKWILRSLGYPGQDIRHIPPYNPISKFFVYLAFVGQFVALHPQGSQVRVAVGQPTPDLNIHISLTLIYLGA